MQAMILKGLKTALKSLLFLTGLTVFTVLLITGTEGGSSWLIRTALENLNAGGQTRISLRQVTGTFFTELAFVELVAEGAGDTEGDYQIAIRTSSLAINPLALLNSEIDLRRLQVNGLTITLNTNERAADPGQALEQQLSGLFNLPVQIQDLELRNIRVLAEDEFRLDQITGELVLNNSQLDLDASIVMDDTRVSGNLELLPGNLDLSGTFTWQSTVAGQESGGALSFTGNPEEFDITHDLSIPYQIHTEGQLQTGLFNNSDLTFNLSHQVNALSGELFNIPTIQNVSGNVETVGSQQQIDLDIAGQAIVAQLGDVQITASTIYTSTQLEDILFNLNSDYFTFSGAGSASLEDTGEINLDWQLLNFSDGNLFSGLELVSVNAEGNVAATRDAGVLSSQVEIAALSGELNGFPLTGSGNLTLSDNSLRDISMYLVADANSLNLTGTVTPELAFSWNLQTPLLEQLIPTLSGSMAGQGSFSGTLEDPEINGLFTAQNLAYRNGDNSYQIASLEADADYAGDSNAISLVYENLQIVLPDRVIAQNTGSLVASGLLENHQLAIQSESDNASLNIEAEGQWLEAGWQGLLSSAQVNSSFGNWRLQDSVALAVSPDQVQIQSHCWRHDRLSVCGQVAWQEAVGLSGNLALDNLPLGFLNKTIPANAPDLANLATVLADRPPGLENLQDQFDVYMPENSFVEGELDLTLEFSGVGEDFSQSRLAMILAPRDMALGLIRQPSLEEETDTLQVESYGIDDIALTVDRRDSQWLLDTEFGIYLPESGGLDFQGNFEGAFMLADDESLGGNFDLRFNNIAWVEALLPTLRNVNGELNANGSIGGNLALPQLLVDASLNNGSFELPEYGLSLEAVDLFFRSDAANELTISGSARSGLGSIALSSRITTPLQNSRNLQATIKGQSFQLMNLPESRVVVDPDLEINIFSNILTVNGSLVVPTMQIDLRNSEALAAAGSVDLSRDAVIINNPPGNPATVASSGGLTGNMPVAGAVSLRMGNAVSFQGFGLDVSLTGDLLLEQSANRPLLANGELSIPTGSYGLYGQELTIANGKLLFLGNPLNPALDIRAIRQTRDAEVGVLMNGTVRKINAQLFSTPSLPESEILSLLITGTSFSRAGEFGNQEGENMLGAIALLGLERGQGLTGNIQNKLGLDSFAISSGPDFRDSALGLGKYLSPRLFMRYDIGLFDRENAISLDYILTERLRLEVESGVSQSIDLTYTVEK